MLPQIEQNVIGCAIESSVLLVGGLIMWALLRHSSAANRHLVLAVALIGCLFLPLGKNVLPKIALPVLAAPVEENPLAVHWAPSIAPSILQEPNPQESKVVYSLVQTSQAGVPSSVALLKPHWQWPLSLRWGSVWWLGVICIGICLSTSVSRLYWLRRSSRIVHLPEAVTENTRLLLAGRRLPEIREHEGVRIPMITGVLHPVIFLPPGWEKWSESCLKSVIRHEITHLVRGDLILQHAINFSLVLYWFNPLCWLAASLLGKEREKACDDLALASGERASIYAEALLEVVRNFQRGSLADQWLPGTSIGMAKRSKVTERIQAILSVAVNRSTPSRGRVAFSIALASVVILALGAVRVAKAVPEEKSTPEPVRVATPPPKDQSAPLKENISKESNQDGDKWGSRSITVVDETGNPVEDAKVIQQWVLMPDRGGNFIAEEGKFVPEVVKTDSKGEAKLRYPIMLSNQFVSSMGVRISHPDFCTEVSTIDLGNPQPVRIVRGAKLTLTAKAGGNPVSDVFAEVAGLQQQSYGFVRKPGSARLPSGSHFARALALDKDGMVLFSEPFEVALNSGEEKTIELKLSRGSDFRGKLSGNVPRPVIGGRVYAEIIVQNPADKVQTLVKNPLVWRTLAHIAPDGTFLLKDIPEGEVWVVGFCNGYVSQNPDPEKRSDFRVQAQLLAPRWGTPELQMAKSGTAEILVLSPEGKPVENARVSFGPNMVFGDGIMLLDEDSTSEDGMRYWLKNSRPVSQKRVNHFSARTGSDGIARIPELPAGDQRFGITAEHLQMPLTQVKVSSFGSYRREASIQINPGELSKKTVTLEVESSEQPSADASHKAPELSAKVLDPGRKPQ